MRCDIGRAILAAVAAALVGAAGPEPAAAAPEPQAGTPRGPSAPAARDAAPARTEGARRAADAEFLYRCVRSLGHPGYCACVTEKRPEAVDFDAFVLFNSRTRTELGYDGLSPDEQKVVDDARAARDACVELQGWE